MKTFFPKKITSTTMHISSVFRPRCFTTQRTYLLTYLLTAGDGD